MDKIDQKLFLELDTNPRIALSKLAKKLRISQQVADYRLKRMLNQEKITKLATIINLKSLRQEHYRVFFTFNAQKEYSNKEIFKYLKNRKGIYWASRIGGKYDLLIVLFVFDFEEFDAFIEDFNQNFPGLIKDYKSCYALDHYIYRHKYLGKKYSSIHYGYNDKIIEVDELDYHILSKLKDNCRLSALELSRGKNVSYKTIINRIKKLEKKNIILGYRIFIKSEEKRPFVVLFSFKDYSRKTEKQLLSHLGGNDSVTQAVRLFGLWNLFLHIRIENNEKLQDLIVDLRHRFNIIDDYEIIPVFEDISIDVFPMRKG